MNSIYDDDIFFAEYAKMARSRNGLAGAGEWHQLKKMLPDFKGRTVLDLGCGYGWHCRFAAEQGAEKILGIDQSEKMIETAKTQNDDERIDYKVCDLEAFDYPEDTYDCVISNLVLHYIEELSEIYRKVYKTLRQGGSFVFNIEHPTFTGSVNQTWVCDHEGEALFWPVDDYFYPGQRETLFLGQRVIKHHHTLSQILGELLDAGFVIKAVEEAVPSEDMLDVPGMRDEMRRPMMLMIRAEK